MTRIYLAAMALMFLAFGAWSLLDPLGMTAGLGVDVGGANGTFEMRGIFGGVSLGAAGLCAAGAARAEMTRPALWFLIAYMGGYCIGRAASVVIGDLPTLGTWRFVAFEAATFVISIIALRQTTR
ncbi:MAG: DUF4345 family protein [Pseudomonadota bacterium]